MANALNSLALRAYRQGGYALALERLRASQRDTGEWGAKVEAALAAR